MDIPPPPPSGSHPVLAFLGLLFIPFDTGVLAALVVALPISAALHLAGVLSPTAPLSTVIGNFIADWRVIGPCRLRSPSRYRHAPSRAWR